MKKNLLLNLIILLLWTVNTYAAVGSASFAENPGVHKQKEKNNKQKIKEIKKYFKEEMRGMSKAEKKSYIEDKIKNENLNIPRKQWLIIGAILILVGIIFYFIPFLWFLGAIIQSIGFIILVIWLILWLMDMA